jgi:hypothetical protein
METRRFMLVSRLAYDCLSVSLPNGTSMENCAICAKLCARYEFAYCCALILESKCETAEEPVFAKQLVP